MKIALVIPSLDAGGAERMLSEIANYWDRKGHAVSIIHMKPEGYKAFYPVNPEIRLMPMIGGVILHPNSKIGKIWEYFKAIIHVGKHIKKIKPDVVISTLSYINIAVLLATLGLKIPIIVSEEHDLFMHPILPGFKWFREQIYRLATCIRVLTPSLISYFSTSLQKKVIAIPNFLDVPNESNLCEIRPIVKSIVSVGRLASQKDHVTVIQAFALLSDEFSEINLVIYGEGPLREALQSLIQKLHLGNRIFLPGITKKIMEVYKEHDVFVLSSRYEGFGLTLGEAMSVGMPVISTNIIGPDIIIDHEKNGLLVAKENIKELAGAMRRLIMDYDLRVQLGGNAKQIVEKFSFEGFTNQWDKLLEFKNSEKLK